MYRVVDEAAQQAEPPGLETRVANYSYTSRLVTRSRRCIAVAGLDLQRHACARQAEHVSTLYGIVDEALHQVEPSSLEGSLVAAEALRSLLEAQETLQANPTEAALKQLLALLQQTSPALREACWLLVTQHDSYRKEARKA